MRLIILVITLFISGCTGTRVYEDIVADVLITRTADNIHYEIYQWEAAGLVVETIGDSQTTNHPKNDHESCVDEYRGIEFEDEVAATSYFFQCMNAKGYHLGTEEVIIIDH